MNIDNTKRLKKTKDYFDDNFEVIYQEEEYSALLQQEMARNKDDDYKDVLSSLSEIDHTDYIRKNRTGYYKFLTRRTSSISKKARKGSTSASPSLLSSVRKTAGKSLRRLADVISPEENADRKTSRHS